MISLRGKDSQFYQESKPDITSDDFYLEKRVSGAKVLLDTISKHGVSYIFAVPGRESETILFNENPNLQVILTAVEFTAGFAAYSHAIVSGKAQVVFSTIGPGAANLANAIYSAYADRVPVVFITAQVETSKRYYNQTHQCIDSVKLYQSITKFAYEVENSNQIEQVLEKAFEISEREPKGPTLISIPIDVLSQNVSQIQEIGEIPNLEITHSPPKVQSIDRAVSILENSLQPLVFVGNEVVRSDSTELIKELCETYNLPLVSSYDTKGVLPSPHELNFYSCTSYAEGILGINVDELVFGPPDCIVAFGYDWKDDVFPNKQFSYGVKKKLISFSGNMPKEFYSSFLHVGGSLKENLRVLLHKLAQRKFKKKKLYDISLLKTAVREKSKDTEAPLGWVNITSVINAINETEAILISDVGTFRHYAVLLSNISLPNTFITSAGSSSFGIGLPLALGARLAHSKTNSKIIALTGDGGFNSCIGDLRTLRNLDINVILIVLDNQENKLISIYQKQGHQQDYPPAYSHAKASFVKIAEGYGCHAFAVSSEEELRQKLQQVLDLNGPVVIHVPIYYPESDIKRLADSDSLV